MYGLFMQRTALSSFKVWLRHDVSFKAAGLTYYAVFAAVPLLSLLVTISTILVNEQFIAAEINRYIGIVFADPVAFRLQQFVKGLINSDYSVALSIGGAAAFLYATTNYFARLNQVVKQVAWDFLPDNQLLENLYQRFKGLTYSVFIFTFIAILSAMQGFIRSLGSIFPALNTFKSIEFLVEILGIALSLMLLAGLLSVYYRSVLGSLASKSSFFIPSLLASLAIYLINIFLSYMLSFSASYYDYGIFSAALSVIVWMFLINTVLICAAGLIPLELTNRRVNPLAQGGDTELKTCDSV